VLWQSLLEGEFVLQIRVNDIDVSFQTRGQGRPLLLVHGFPLDHSMWRFQFEVLARDYKVIAPDLRGFGQTTRGTASVSMKQFAEDLVGLLEALSINDPVTYCGLSMGGYIGWEFWRNFPDRLCRLIQCDTRSIGDTELIARGRRQMAGRITEQGPNGSALAAETMIPKLFSEYSAQAVPERVSQLKKVIANSDHQMIAETQLALATRADVTTWLPDIDIPALLICGEHDAISPAEEMKVIADAMPNVKLEIIENVGHMAPLEHPLAVNNVIRQFLKQTDSSC